MVAPNRGWSSIVNHVDNLTQTHKAAALLTRHYVQKITVQNKHATVATTVSIRNGTVVLFTINCPAVQTTPVVIDFAAMPLATDINAAVTVICGTTGADVLVNLQGFSGGQ